MLQNNGTHSSASTKPREAGGDVRCSHGLVFTRNLFVPLSRVFLVRLQADASAPKKEETRATMEEAVRRNWRERAAEKEAATPVWATDHEAVVIIFISVAVGLLVLLWLRTAVHWWQRAGIPEDLPTRTEVERVAQAMRRRPVDPAQPLGDDTCAICMDRMQCAVELLPCGHLFCAGCLDTYWSSTGRYRRLRCPLDRDAAELLVPAYHAREQIHGNALHTTHEADALVAAYNGGVARATTSLTTVLAAISGFFAHQHFLPLALRVRAFAIILFAVTYALSPWDLISESIAGFIGLIDDVLVILFCIAFLFTVVARRF